MKILFLGNFEAEYSSENYYKRTLEKMGHNVIPVQEGHANYSALYEASNSLEVDLFFWVKTHGWQTPGIEDFLKDYRFAGGVSFAYHLDLYMGLQREPMLYTDPFFTVDHFFTVDKLMADWLNANTSCSGHYLPAGVFEDDCFLAAPNRDRYPHDIVFTGSTNYHPEYSYRNKLVNWLSTTYGDKFAHYGPGGLPSVRGPELNTLYASAKIVIGDTLCKDFKYPWYFSDRAFEVPGRGGFMIFPRIEGIDTMYAAGRDIVLYNYNAYHFDDLQYKIDLYLQDDIEWERIRRSGFERVKKEHTYTKRFETILKILGIESTK